MLFAAKKRASTALLTAAGLLLLSVLIGIRDFVPTSGAPDAVLGGVLLGGALLGLSDAGLHALFSRFGGRDYLERFEAFLDYFAGQGLGAIAAAGVLAASEEVFFRGALLNFILTQTSLDVLPAAALTASLFGALHLIPERRLAPFSIWAVWEGGLLTLIYLVSDSLRAVAALHAIHDVVGFAYIGWRRSKGGG